MTAYLLTIILIQSAFIGWLMFRIGSMTDNRIGCHELANKIKDKLYQN